jgi:hypothetical protein
MIAIVWKFQVKSGEQEAFERLYGVDGDWSRVNRATRSFLGTSFLRNQNDPAQYLVTEYWSEMLVYEQQRVKAAETFEAVEQMRAALVESIEPLGVFTALDVPDRAGPTWSQRRSS